MIIHIFLCRTESTMPAKKEQEWMWIPQEGSKPLKVCRLRQGFDPMTNMATEPLFLPLYQIPEDLPTRLHSETPSRSITPESDQDAAPQTQLVSKMQQDWMNSSGVWSTVVCSDFVWFIEQSGYCSIDTKLFPYRELGYETYGCNLSTVWKNVTRNTSQLLDRTSITHRS